MSFNEDMKKILLAGIGAVATTVEKSQDLVDHLISKGELTVEQGKVLNEELKRKRKSVKENEGNDSTPQDMDEHKSILDQLDNLNEEELAALKKKLAEMEK